VHKKGKESGEGEKKDSKSTLFFFAPKDSPPASPPNDFGGSEVFNIYYILKAKNINIFRDRRWGFSPHFR